MNREQTQPHIRVWRRPVAAGLLVIVALMALAGLGPLAQARPSASPTADLFSEGFEGATSTWQLSAPVLGVGWNLRSTSQQYGKAYSGSKAMWFGDPVQGQYGGNCFLVPEANCPIFAGNLEYVGAPILIPANFTYASLIFQSWSSTEQSFVGGCGGAPTCLYDKRQVWISSTTDTNWQLKWSTDVNPSVEKQWQAVSINLSAYTGKSIRILFTFDTDEDNPLPISHYNPGDDSAANKPAGWFVDDIRIFAFTPSSFVYLPIVRK